MAEEIDLKKKDKKKKTDLRHQHRLAADPHSSAAGLPHRRHYPLLHPGTPNYPDDVDVVNCPDAGDEDLQMDCSLIFSNF